MIRLTKFSILESCLTEPYVFQDIKLWKEKIQGVILDLLESTKITLISVNPKLSDICYEFPNYKKGEFNDTSYLYSPINGCSMDLIREVINSEEFILGNSIFYFGDFCNSEIERILVCWRKDLSRAGVEFIKMDNDGHYFNWYNPNSIEMAETLIMRLMIS